jgi:hypothetical protein
MLVAEITQSDFGTISGIGAFILAAFAAWSTYTSNKAKQSAEKTASDANADKTKAEADAARLTAEALAAKTRAEADAAKIAAEMALRQAAANDNDRVIKSMQSEIDRLNKRVESYENRIDSFEREIAEYRERMTFFEKAGTDIPVPAWELDNSGKVIKVNNAFDSMLLTPMKDEKGRSQTRGDILGKTAQEFWGDEPAKMLQVIDAAAAKSIDHTASACGFKFRPDIGPFIIVKSIRIWEGRAIGVFGMAIPMTTEVKITSVPCVPQA